MINRPRGTRDLFSDKASLYHWINLVSSELLKVNSYKQIILPTYEYEELFLRSLGSTTDVISKEMFIFNDRKGRKMALRPEGTAAVVRAVLQNNLLKEDQPLRLYYNSNMFRYERPQSGRYREFWQLGVELINAKGIFADCEVLLIAQTLLTKFKVTGFRFLINYLGSELTRENYKNALKSFLSSCSEFLCMDCKNRYLKNPLRIMECMSCSSFPGMPDYLNYLSTDEFKYFRLFQAQLSALGICWTIDQKLVRGLDYYTGLVFEVKVNDSDKSILGGGRYDNIFNELANQHVPAVGFALGIDRLAEIIQLSNQNHNAIPDFFIVALHETALPSLLPLKLSILNNVSNIIVNLSLQVEKTTKISKLINKQKAYFVVLIGEKELNGSFLTVKNTFTRTTDVIPNKLFISWIERFKGLGKGDNLINEQ